MSQPQVITGGLHHDHRGTIGFVNDFDMEKVRRLYHITHNDVNVIRAWQGHQVECKWFHCIRGAFELRVIKIDDWKNPSASLKWETYFLNGQESSVVFLPGGYVNGFRAIEKNSTLIVFSDQNLEESKNDDYRFDQDYWFKWEKL